MLLQCKDSYFFLKKRRIRGRESAAEYMSCAVCLFFGDYPLFGDAGVGVEFDANLDDAFAVGFVG